MNSTPTLADAALLEHEALEQTLRNWCVQAGGSEHRFPSLIAAETLEKAEYPKAFPHLAIATAVAADPAAGFAQTRPAGWFLSPAVCYHVYAHFAGRTLAEGVLVCAQGTCFRFEDAAELVPGRRQIEFEMRELVLLGAEDWITQTIERLQPQITACGAALHPEVAWCPANDPFFLPQIRGKAHLQRLLGLKIELCLPDGLAIASINRHGTFFGERFGIHQPNGEPIHTACLAFGLDRWAYAARAFHHE